MAFIKAERTNLFLRCALFGPSGSGKTMTALRIAKGIAGKMKVPVAVIDSESRSASKYADRFTFDVDNLEKKTVDHYIASINDAAKKGYKVLVIDSLSHAWRELTEEVDRITQASVSKNNVLSWGKVNPKQKRFIDAILNFPGHIIVTMRSKTEWVMNQNKDGKIAPEKLGLAPEQGKNIEYEFDLLIEINQAHHATVTKDRTGKFQDETIEKPDEAFGVALYEWLANGKAETSVQNSEKTISKSQPAQAKLKIVKPDSSGNKPTLKERGDGVIKEIGTIITANDKNGTPHFTEEEKEGARQIIASTKLSDKGLIELNDLKVFLSDELSKRESKKAA